METKAFTDIHCHILPGVDDGARSMEQAIDMLHIAYGEGIRKVILTPHFHGGHMETDVSTLRERFMELQIAASREEQAKEMQLFLGCEIYHFDSMPEWIEEDRLLTMADTDYVLLEFGYTTPVRDILRAISGANEYGLIPVIAHVERYREAARDIKNIEEFVKNGAYIQINSESIRGFRTNPLVKKIIKHHLLSFVATDAHNRSSRAPRLLEAYKYIAKKCGEDYADEIFINNPERMLHNEEIPRRI